MLTSRQRAQLITTLLPSSIHRTGRQTLSTHEGVLLVQEVAKGVTFSVSGVPISAGFVERDPNGHLICCGRSDGLGLERDPEDTVKLGAWLKSLPKRDTEI